MGLLLYHARLRDLLRGSLASGYQGQSRSFLNTQMSDRQKQLLGVFHRIEDLPNDVDISWMIRNGMSGTAMPDWADILLEQDMIDVTAYIKIFVDLEGVPEVQLDYGTQVATSAESIAAGKVLFEDGDRCTECHGLKGKGDAIKKLKNDNSERTWPRNLTKPWTFRASNDPKDIYARVSASIPTTQMPSFADPKSKKKLTIQERWHVANYVASLAKTKNVVRPENFVIQGERLECGSCTTSNKWPFNGSYGPFVPISTL